MWNMIGHNMFEHDYSTSFPVIDLRAVMWPGSDQLNGRGNLWWVLWKPILPDKVETCTIQRPHSFLHWTAVLEGRGTLLSYGSHLQLWGKSQGRAVGVVLPGTVLLLDFWLYELTNLYCLSHFLLESRCLLLKVYILRIHVFIRYQNRD